MIIYNPKIFIKNLYEAVAHKLEKSDVKWEAASRQIQYVDPLYPPNIKMELFFTKHFRYWYQQEYRVAWVPEKSKCELNALEIEIGDMSQYASYFELI